MDILNVYCDLKEGVRDTDFSDAVHSRAANLMIALYRDFPEAARVRGQEKF